MANVAAREQYFELLLNKVQAERHPSPTLVDRLVRSIRSRDHAEQVVDVLFDRIGRHPSPTTLDRLDDLISRVELAEQLQERRKRVAGS